MEPAMALCAGVATATLTFGVLRSLPVAVRAVAAVHIPVPERSIAALLVVTSVVVLLVRPRPSAATVPPPIVRLTDSARAGDADGEPTIAELDLPGADAGSGSARSIRSDPADSRGDTYIVHTGDSLWRIAERTLVARTNGTVSSTDIAQFWPVIYEVNRALIGDDPNLIFPGQTLQIPEV